MLNPNSIARFNKNAKTVFEEFNYAGFANSPELKLNFSQIDTTLKEAFPIIDKIGIDRQNVVWCLIPKFGKGKPDFLDSRVGGLPIITKFHDGWPNCNVCNKPLRLIAQVDMRPWASALHYTFSDHHPHSFGNYGYSSSLGNHHVVPATYIYTHSMWEFFACSMTHEHYDNPNSDGRIYISNLILEAGEKRTTSLIQPKWGNDSFVPADQGKKIIGLDFRLELDMVKTDWGKVDELESTKRDDLFNFKSSTLKFFGSAQSQQTPNRYWCHSGELPRRMTPVVSWFDKKRDMTYQMYSDTMRTEGVQMFAKVDASST